MPTPDIDALFRALADPTRRAIVKMLRKGSLTSGEIAARFESTWATISRHLSVLREANLISAHRTGSSISYALNVAELHQLQDHIRDWTEQGEKHSA